jgi:hypothetical protein
VREGSGKQFDPQVVAAFEQALARDTLTVLVTANDAPAPLTLIPFPASILPSQNKVEKVAVGELRRRS